MRLLRCAEPTANWNRKALQAEAAEGRLPAKPFRAANFNGSHFHLRFRSVDKSGVLC
jgi:hypothetical protein